MSEEEAEELAESIEQYAAFYVPKSARWGELKDLKKDIGNQLNKALSAVEDANPELDGVLKHIDFNAKKGKTRISDSKLQDFWFILTNTGLEMRILSSLICLVQLMNI